MKHTPSTVKKFEGVITDPKIPGKPAQNPEPKVKKSATKILNSSDNLDEGLKGSLQTHPMQIHDQSAPGQRVINPSAAATPTTVPKNSKPVENSIMIAEARVFTSSIVTPEIEALLNNPDFLYNKNERGRLTGINSDQTQELAQMSSMGLGEWATN